MVLWYCEECSGDLKIYLALLAAYPSECWSAPPSLRTLSRTAFGSSKEIWTAKESALG